MSAVPTSHQDSLVYTRTYYTLLSILCVPQLCFALLYYAIMKAFVSVDLKFPYWRNIAIFHSSLFHVSPKNKYANSSGLPAWVLGTHLLKTKHHFSLRFQSSRLKVWAKMKWDLPPKFPYTCYPISHNLPQEMDIVTIKQRDTKNNQILSFKHSNVLLLF